MKKYLSLLILLSFTSLSFAQVGQHASILDSRRQPPIYEITEETHLDFQKMIRKDKKHNNNFNGEVYENEDYLATRFYNEELEGQHFISETFVKDYCGGHLVYMHRLRTYVGGSWQNDKVNGQTSASFGLSYTRSRGRFDVSQVVCKYNSSDVQMNSRVSNSEEAIMDVAERSEQKTISTIIESDLMPEDVAIDVEQNTEVFEQGAGYFTLYTSSYDRKYYFDGYEVTLSTTTPDIIQIATDKVTTDAQGTVNFRVCGKKVGIGHLVATIDYPDAESVNHVLATREIDVEVIPPQWYSYTYSITDRTCRPTVSFTVNGEFEARYVNNGQDCSTDPELIITSSPAFMMSPQGETMYETVGNSITNGKTTCAEIVLDIEGYKKLASGGVVVEIMRQMTKGAQNFVHFVQTGGDLPEPEPNYKVPAMITLPIEEGTFTFSYGIELFEQFESEGGFKPEKLLAYKCVSLPSVQKFIQAMSDLSMVGEDGDIGMNGTLTIKKIEPKE